MAVSTQQRNRCVVWFGEPTALERAHLTTAGWQIRAIAPGQSPALGLRGEDLVVAVVDVCLHCPARLSPVTALLSEHDHLPVIYLCSVQAKETQPPQRSNAAIHLPSHDAAALVCALEHAARVAGLPLQAHPTDRLLGDSPVMHALRATLTKFAPVELPVLITGQTGTGKEMAAHALHLRSNRKAKPFRAVNCGAIPANLVQSELFGHERGAFTGAVGRREGLFESADGGTVFLDEIGDLPLDAQTSLLRVLQENTVERVGSNQSIRVDVRIIAATHVNLEDAVAHGRFREDLYYRLNVLRLTLPALRERQSDITLLATHFLDEFRKHHRVRARGFSCSARQAMEDFPWPGNVRELLNRVQRAAITAESELISCQDLDLSDPSHTSESPRADLARARARSEIEALQACLKKTGYNISACARMMKVSRVTIYRLCKKYQIALTAMR